jgi:CRISPR system Cascade subunit CasA
LNKSQSFSAWNLLTEPFLRVVTEEGRRQMTLPGLLYALGRDEVRHYEGIQRHQEDAFHVFLCYLACVVLVRNELTDPLQDEGFWRQSLRDLAQGFGDDPWTLVVNDLTRPAFMQPPTPSADHKKFAPLGRDVVFARAADAMDLLVTSKNHDVKRARAIHTEPDCWFYSLISLQTMSGYSGAGKHGIARMNSGYGSRPIIELVRETRPGVRWHDAVIRLFDHRREVLSGPYGFDPEGLVLLWTKTWDGDESLPLSSLDPFFIEICRRVRLKANEGSIHVEDMSSKAPRIQARDLKGVVGDAWIPIDLNGRSGNVQALTISPQGLTSRTLHRILFGEQLELSVLHRPLPGWKNHVLWMNVSVLVRGQGKTDGFHEKQIPIPPKVHPRLFGSPQQREPLAELSRNAIEYASIMQNRVLKPAVFSYLQGGGDKIDYNDVTCNEWWLRAADRFGTQWSDEYFRWLWSVPEPIDQETALLGWASRLREHAFGALQQVKLIMPLHSGRRFRACSYAESAFAGLLYTHFPMLRGVEHAKSTIE